jgi:hypothetical protein
MHETDQQVLKGLHSLQRGYDALLNLRQTAGDRYNTAKAVIDAEWQADMQPVIEDLYWHPLRNGIDSTPDDEGELRTWLEDRYRDAAIVLILLLLLRRYQVRAYNLGGQTGLDMLSLDGTFNLTDPDILARLDAHAGALTTVGGDISLINTTIDDLVIQIPKAKQNEGSAALYIAAFIALRASQRTETIERTERPFQVGNALDEVFVRNGVQLVMYDVNGVGCVKICAPLHGATWPAGGAPRQYLVPRHPRCDCIHSPVLYDGQAVGYPPVTVSAPGLQPWVPQPSIWMGGLIA